MRQTRDRSASYPRASEVLDAVLRAVVFPALRVIPFDPEPCSSRAMNRTDELDRPDVSCEKYACTDPWRTGGHRCPVAISVTDPKRYLNPLFTHTSSDLVRVTGGGPSEPGGRLPVIAFRSVSSVRPHLSVQAGEASSHVV